jgi:hypothetical protein
MTAFSRETSMTTRNFCLLAAVIFAVIAILQLARALAGLPVTVGSFAIPILPSWIAAIVLAGLAWLGYRASRR